METAPTQGMPRQPVAPTPNEWQKLKEDWKVSREPPVVDVLVPVYRGFTETMRCLYNVLAYRQKTPFRLVVVDDCSPDFELKAAIEQLCAQGFLDLHQTDENLGFVGACNIGLALHSDRDVVLLNSDAEVYNDWLDRLCIAAYRNPKTATVTPFSNNATICSYPYFIRDNIETLEIDDAQLDLLAKSINANGEVEVPTGVGFCMYVRRACLDEIGFLDRENFGKGYGEENDLCMRAIAAGWRNIIATDAFVRHYGATSFGAAKTERIKAAIKVIEHLHPTYSDLVDEFVKKDPVRPFRENLDKARILRGSKDRAVLFVVHRWNRKTDNFVQGIIKTLEIDGERVLFVSKQKSTYSKIKVSFQDIKETPNLPIFDMRGDACELAVFLSQVGISYISICSIDGFFDKISKFVISACKKDGLAYDIRRHSPERRVTFFDASVAFLKEFFN